MKDAFKHDSPEQVVAERYAVDPVAVTRDVIAYCERVGQPVELRVGRAGGGGSFTSPECLAGTHGKHHAACPGWLLAPVMRDEIPGRLVAAGNFSTLQDFMRVACPCSCHWVRLTISRAELTAATPSWSRAQAISTECQDRDLAARAALGGRCEACGEWAHHFGLACPKAPPPRHAAPADTCEVCGMPREAAGEVHRVTCPRARPGDGAVP